MSMEQMRRYYQPATGCILKNVVIAGKYRSIYVFLPLRMVPMRDTLSAAEVGAGRSEK